MNSELRTMNRYTATIISTVFEPLLVLAGIAVIGGFQAQLTSIQMVQYLLSLFLCMIGPVIVFRVWLVRKHGIDWDIHDRRRRIKPLLAMCGFVIVDTLIISLLRSPILNHIFLFFIIWSIGFLLITTKWKISGHTGISALASGFIVIWYGWQYFPLLLIPVIVGWARIVRRDHSFAQAVAGIVYSWSLLFAFKLLGY